MMYEICSLNSTVSANCLQIAQSQVSIVVESCFISTDCTQIPPMLPNGVRGVFIFFIFSFIDLFILEATVTWILWYDQKAQGSPGSCSINHGGEGGLVDCLCPRLWCNQRVRPCCSQPETQHLMRMLCTGSPSHTNPALITAFCFPVSTDFDTKTSDCQMAESKYLDISHMAQAGISKKEPLGSLCRTYNGTTKQNGKTMPPKTTNLLWINWPCCQCGQNKVN